MCVCYTHANRKGGTEKCRSTFRVVKGKETLFGLSFPVLLMFYTRCTWNKHWQDERSDDGLSGNCHAMNELLFMALHALKFLIRSRRAIGKHEGQREKNQLLEPDLYGFE